MILCLSIIAIIILGVVVQQSLCAFNNYLDNNTRSLRAAQFDLKHTVMYKDSDAEGKHGGWFVTNEDMYLQENGFSFRMTEYLNRCTFYSSEYQARKALERYLKK